MSRRTLSPGEVADLDSSGRAGCICPSLEAGLGLGLAAVKAQHRSTVEAAGECNLPAPLASKCRCLSRARVGVKNEGIKLP